MKFTLLEARPVCLWARSIALGATVLLGTAGCESVRPADPSLNAIRLTEQHKAFAGAASIQFPAGVYHPDFTTRQGIYYRAPSPLVTTRLGSDTIEGGGVYFPNSSDRDQRQGAWLDREERMFGIGLQTPAKVYRLEKPVPFEVGPGPRPAGASAK